MHAQPKSHVTKRAAELYLVDHRLHDSRLMYDVPDSQKTLSCCPQNNKYMKNQLSNQCVQTLFVKKFKSPMVHDLAPFLNVAAIEAD